jgi:hypothetical protein
MKADNLPALRAGQSWYDAGSCALDDLMAAAARSTRAEDVPLASRIARNAPVYDCRAIRALAATPDGRRAVMAEWIWVLRD